MRQPKIALVELPPTAFGRLDGEPVQDMYHGFNMPDRAMGYLYSILYKDGFRDLMIIDPKNQRRSGKLHQADIDTICSSDILLLSAITRTIPQTIKLANIYHSNNPSGIVIAGGPHVTNDVENSLEWADIIVRHEGYITARELLHKLQKTGSPESVLGVSYKKDSKLVHEPDRPFLTPEELSDLPLPHRVNHEIYDIETMITSLGCPYQCDFCGVSAFYGTTYRRRSNTSILKELEIQQGYPQKTIFLADDNFAYDRDATIELLDEMIRRGYNKKRYIAQISINSIFDRYSDIDDEFLVKMKQVGMTMVCVGIESINAETLRSLKKPATVKRNKEGIKALRDRGLWVHGMMMIGGDGDDKQSLEETLEWTKHNLDSVQFFAPAPLPGTEFHRKMEKEGRIISTDYYLYDGFYVLIRPKHLTPFELQKTIIEMHQKFYKFSFANGWNKQMVHLYGRKTTRDIMKSRQMREHLKFLRKLR